MPYLPFTSANLTEIAKWQASDPTVLTVNYGNLLSTTPAQPSGGRTIGTKVGTSDNTGSVRQSNSGIAVNSVLTALDGVDPTDSSSTQSDAQPFQVGGTTQSAGDAFNVGITGGGLNPYVFFTVRGRNSVNASRPATATISATTGPRWAAPLVRSGLALLV